MVTYSLAEIQAIKTSGLMTVPINVSSILETLNSQLIIPSFETISSKPSNSSFVKHNGNNKKRVNDSTTPSDNDSMWKTVRTTFKPTTLSVPKDKSEQNINDIRTILNKLSVKNYQEQKTLIFQRIQSFASNELESVAKFVFDVASANKFYSELYADLYKELLNDFPVFKEILANFVANYKTTICEMEYKDANTDYDGYCKYVKENDKRKAIATFLVMLSNRNTLEFDILLDIIQHFQTLFLEYIKQDNKSKECDEISDLLHVFLSNIKDVKSINGLLWTEIVKNVQFISKVNIKEKEFPSLTSRSVFKHLDIHDLLFASSSKAT